MEYFDQIDIAELLVKKMLGTTSSEEEERLREWVEISDRNKEIYEDFLSGRSFVWRKKEFGYLKYGKTMTVIQDKIKRKTRRRILMRASSVAVVLLVAVLSTVAFYSLREKRVRPETLPQVEGKYYAILSVDDGQKVVLKEDASGTEWQEHVKESVPDKSVPEKKVQMIRVEVPRGSEYWLRLNDSTGVWLNSETVLTYPDRFTGDKREVFLQGEGFFEVKSNPAKPFVVHTKEELLIRVTGTQLNVRNYADEQFLKVTLLKGIVQVGNDTAYQVLAPSEQAVFNRETGDVTVVTLADPSTCIAWREGMFAFEAEKIETIFAAMAQWYDVEFVIENKYAVPDSKVTFHAMRDERVEELLNVLQSLINFKYRVVEKRIYINF